LGNLIDLSRHAGWQLAAQVEWNVENDQVCNKLPTSFQPKIANTNKLATWVWQLVSN